MVYKRDYDKEYENYDGTEKVKKRRAARNKARRYMERNGRVHKGDGKDVDHKDGGLYIITDICHQLTSEGTYTRCNLARDSFGRKPKKR